MTPKCEAYGLVLAQMLPKANPNGSLHLSPLCQRNSVVFKEPLSGTAFQLLRIRCPSVAISHPDELPHFRNNVVRSESRVNHHCRPTRVAGIETCPGRRNPAKRPPNYLRLRDP